MDGTLRRAVAAGYSRDIAHLEPLLRGAGYALIGRGTDGAVALRLIRELQPDLAITDAILPGLDGVAFAGRARALKLNVHPAILLLRPAGLRLPGEEQLPALGALTADAPLTADSLHSALERLNELRSCLPPEKAERLKALMDALGVPEHPGRDCLRCAVGLIWSDRRKLRALRQELYPEVARRTGCAPAQAERAIRHVIDAAWRTGEIEQQHRIFGDTIDARRGRPTCGEMIAQLADILRWEG